MHIELAACTATLLNEIQSGANQQAVAQTYRLAMQSSFETDWAAVNEAIIKRWSLSGLQRIKQLAWSGKAFSDVSGRTGSIRQQELDASLVNDK